MHLLSIRNMLDIGLSGSVKYLAFLHKDSRPNMVLNRVEAEMPQRRLTPTLILNFGVNIMIGLPSKSQNMKKNVIALLSVSLAEMNVTSTTPLVIDED